MSQLSLGFPPRSLGIVGPDARRFTPETERAARAVIRVTLAELKPARVVSGACPLGGVDLYAEEVARELGIPVTLYAPRVHRWGGPGGYRERNLLIADASDIVLVVTIAAPTACAHCEWRSESTNHVQSGGCWTAWRSRLQRWAVIGSMR